MGAGISKGIGPNAKLELLEFGGHEAMTDDLQRFMNIILSFME
ncbi:hypothetical protein [Sedimentibacter hydroxybenzoicus]|nr:hypothetical protein [Sedimentibacter hydroxybenzoicus]